MNSIFRYSLSFSACLLGLLVGGSALTSVEVQSTATPTSSRPQMKRVYHPAAGLHFITGLILIGSGASFAVFGGSEEEGIRSLPQIESEQFLDFTEDDVELPEPEDAPVASGSTRIQSVPTRLQKPVEEYSEVRSLLYENSLAIIGPEKGSGKTSKLGWIIGEHIKQGHLVWFCNPFAAYEEFHGLKVFGRGVDHEESASIISLFSAIAVHRIKLRGTTSYKPFEDVHIHLALDEMSDYADAIYEIDEEVLANFWKAAIQFVRQANMSFAIASHGMTKSMMGGKALDGKMDTIQKGVTQLYAQAKLDPSVLGGKSCRGTANLISYEGDNRISTQIKIPSWMQGPPNYDYTQLIAEHLPNYEKINAHYLSGDWLKTTEPFEIANFRSSLSEDIWGEH